MKKSTTTKRTPKRSPGTRPESVSLPPTRDLDPEWRRLSEAIAVIVTSEATPTKLYNSVIDFLSSNSGELWGGLMVTPPMIHHILIQAACKESLQDLQDEGEVQHA